MRAQAHVDRETARQEAAATAGDPVTIADKSSALKTKIKTQIIDKFAPIEDPVRRAIKKGAEIKPLHNIIHQIDHVLRADSHAGQFVKDLGLDKLIADVGKKDYKTFNQYAIAKHHVETVAATGKLVGRDLGEDKNLVKHVEATNPTLVKHYQTYRGIRDKMLDAAHSGIREGEAYKLISKETRDHLRKTNNHYSSFERIFSHNEHLEAPQGGGGNKLSVSKSDFDHHMKGSNRAIANPLETTLKQAMTLVKQGEAARASRLLAELGGLEGNPLKVRALRLAEKVKTRQEVSKYLSESRPTRDRLAKVARSHAQAIKEITKEQQRLKGEGLGKLVKDKDKIKNYMISRDTGETVARGKGTVRAPGDTSLPKQRLAGSGSKLSTKPMDPESLLQEYLNSKDGGFKHIVDRLAKNDKTVARLRDELDGISNDLHDIKTERANAFRQGQANADIKSTGLNTFSTINDGIKEIYEAGPEVIQAAKALNAKQLGLVGKVFQYGTRVLRLGATGVNVGFAAVNLPRDIASAMINSEHPFRTSPGNPNVFIAALKASFNHNSKESAELVRQGASGTSFDMTRGAERLSIDKLLSKRNAGTRLSYAARHPIHTADDLLRVAENTIGRSEEFTRALQYYGTKEAKLATGKYTQAEARSLAGHAARNNTVNFARSGEIGKVLNTTLPYLNAGIQGSRTLVRNLNERPAETGAKIAITALLPMAATTAYNLSDPKRREIYMQLGEQDLRNSFIIITDKAKRDPKTGEISGVIRIPISQEIGNLTRIVGNGVEALHQDKNFDFKAMAADLFGTTTSLQAKSLTDAASQLTPQALKPGLETAFNKNFYTGQQIVPDAIKNIDAKDQYSDKSSGVAVTVGKMTNWSPMKIDNFIKTAAGGGGQQAINFIDRGLAQSGITEKDRLGGKSIIQSATDRFDKAHSKSDGTIYFAALADTARKYKLAGSDYALLNYLTSKELDGTGKAKLVTDQNAFTTNAALAHNPAVAHVKAEAAVVAAKASGKPLDPLYQATDAQRQAYYTIHSTPRGSAEYLDLYQKNKAWLTPLNEARSKFFTDHPIKGSDGKPIPNAKIPYPVQDDTATALQDQFFAMTDPVQKRDFMKAHPEMQDVWDKKAAYTNQVRQATNYSPLVDRPKASAEAQAALNAGNFKDPAAQAYLNQTNLYNINKKGGLAAIQGNDVSQSELKAISGLGRYGLVKNPDGSLAVAGSNKVQAGAQKLTAYGSGGGRRGRKKGIAKYKPGRRLKGLKVAKLKGVKPYKSTTFKTANVKLTPKKVRTIA